MGAFAGCKSAPEVENEIPESPPAETTASGSSSFASHDGALAESANPVAANRVHVVKGGDTLFGLARQYYGDQTKWRKIFEANRDRIPNKDDIKIGQTIVIPD